MIFSSLCLASTLNKIYKYNTRYYLEFIHHNEPKCKKRIQEFWDSISYFGNF